MQPSLLCKGLRGAQWHLGSYDCQNLHHNTHKRGGPKWPPIPPQGLKMRSRTTGIFYKKNSFRSFYKKTPSVHFTKQNESGEIYLPPPPLLPGLTGTRAIELWQRNFRLFSLSEISRYRSARCSLLPTRTFKTASISRYLGVKSKKFFRKISYKIILKIFHNFKFVGKIVL